MFNFKVTLSRVEYYQEIFYVTAENEEDAQEKAWDQSGNWKLVDDEQFTNHIFLTGESNA